ncbi:hypothetical protein JCM1840_001143 [Sporobolomyces johnsonii]
MARKLGIPGIAAHTAPTGLTAFLRYFFLHRKNKKNGDPSSELAYYEGLKIVRRFLEYASTHGVTDLQTFTASHVPSPSWVSKVTVTVPDDNIDRAADLLRKALEVDPKTVELVGGTKWWTMRGRALTGEWIELKKDKLKRGANPPERVLLYIHGGAHFFSSLETHRYQIQRHARKLGARAFAPSMRLAPQYPFPCALHDVLASYLFLIDPPESAGHSAVPPSSIIISGDSAGAGLALSLLVLLRDLGLPQPAGATLISPWVDLAHSFPSVAGDDAGDYIPSRGFIYRPDIAWPPPPSRETGIEQVLLGEDGGEVMRIDEQVQMYCPNNMLDHPLVSPVNQGSLGGLPPLYICCGGAELLRDEIMYIAHKAANPTTYPPSSHILSTYPSQDAHLRAQYPPTMVQLQVFDGACHVATTLSITSIAKYMYRGAANAGLHFLEAAKIKAEREKAQHSEGHRHHHTTNSHSHSRSESALNGDAPAVVTSAVNADAVVSQALEPSDGHLANTRVHSDLSSDSESSLNSESSASTDSLPLPADGEPAALPDGAVLKVTGHLPPFDPKTHMIRQRVGVHGVVRPLEPEPSLPGCTMDPEAIGKLHAGPVRKWLAQRAKWDDRYAADLAKFRRIRVADRAKAVASGFLLGQFGPGGGEGGGGGENPPLCALAGFHDPELARAAGKSVDEAVGKKTSATMALAMWSKVSSKPDEETAGPAKVEEVKQKVGPERVHEAEQTPAA